MSVIVLGWHFLSPDGTAHGGYRPPRVGDWEPAIENPSPCLRGYHGSPTILKALEYAQGPILGRCEYRDIVWDEDRTKWAARERRCIARVDASSWLRFAAAHFAEEALTRAGVTDERALGAIRVARQFALGFATAKDLAAARAAACDAARYAARAAARDAARAAEEKWIEAVAWDAAWDAARAVAWDAAWAAARAVVWDAARDAEEKWLEEAAMDLDTAPAYGGRS